MSDGQLEGALRLGGGLVAVGLVTELVSFFWNHPLAFIAFAVVGGGLIAVGVLVFLSAAVRAKAWKDPVGSGHGGSVRKADPSL